VLPQTGNSTLRVASLVGLIELRATNGQEPPETAAPPPPDGAGAGVGVAAGAAEEPADEDPEEDPPDPEPAEPPDPEPAEPPDPEPAEPPDPESPEPEPGTWSGPCRPSWLGVASGGIVAAWVVLRAAGALVAGIAVAAAVFGRNVLPGAVAATSAAPAAVRAAAPATIQPRVLVTRDRAASRSSGPGVEERCSPIMTRSFDDHAKSRVREV
jgi:hypothetical protein